MSLRWTASGLAAVVLLFAGVPGQEKGQEKEKPATPEAKPDPRLALKERMKQRLASLDRLRASGKVESGFRWASSAERSASSRARRASWRQRAVHSANVVWIFIVQIPD